MEFVMKFVTKSLSFPAGIHAALHVVVKNMHMHCGVHRVLARLGFREVEEDDDWNLMWSDSCISLTRMIEMKKFQVKDKSIINMDSILRHRNTMIQCVPMMLSYHLN
jgi:hypothetical protein